MPAAARQDAPWRLYVLGLRTMRETAPAERRSVDDQAVWKDARTLVYAMPGDHGADLHEVSANGSGKARLISRAAVSPAYVR